MTKFYKKMPVIDAFSVGARSYPGGLKKLSERMNKSEAILRNKLDRDVDTHVLSLEEGLQIIELLDVTVPSAANGIVKAMTWRLSRIAIRHDGVDTTTEPFGTQLMRLIDGVAELGGFARETISINADGVLINDKRSDDLDHAISRCCEVLFQMSDYIDHHRATEFTTINRPRPLVKKSLHAHVDVQRENSSEPDRRVLPHGDPLRVLTTPKNGK